MSIAHQLVRFVFANENDRYYRESLLALDFRHQLWFRLHDDGYENVYFLNWKHSDSCFEITSLGDKGQIPFVKKFFLHGSLAAQQCRWINDRLSDNPTSALVISLEDFHTAFNREEWKPLIEELRKLFRSLKYNGSLILTASVYVEESQKLLLEDPVLEQLSDTIKNLKQRNKSRMYTDLKHDPHALCMFLNEYTPERIRAILLRVAMDQNIYMEDSVIDGMAEYLMFYLHSPDMRYRTGLFEDRRIQSSSLYKEIYQYFCNEDTWNLLVRETQKLLNGSAASVRTALRETYGPAENESGDYTPVFMHTADLLCFQPRIMEIVKENLPDQADALRTIQYELRHPQNRIPNSKIQSRIRAIDNNLNQIHNKYDYEVMKYRIKAIQFCVQWLYITEEEIDAVLNLIQRLETCCIDLAVKNSNMKTDLDHMPLIDNEVMKRRRNQFEVLISTSEKRLKQYDEVITGTIFGMTLKTNIEVSMRLLQDADEQLKLIEEEQSDTVDDTVPGNSISMDDSKYDMDEEKKGTEETYEIAEWMYHQ